MNDHELKCEKPYFESVADGDKTFEIRFTEIELRRENASLRAEITRLESLISAPKEGTHIQDAPITGVPRD